MKRRLLGWMFGILSFAMIAGASTASSHVVVMPGEPVRPLVVLVPNIDQSNEVAPYISTYQVDAKVNGLYATVTTEFTITNPNHRVMEGELVFPLPDNAVISGYAIDINGVMVDAQIVEKKKARIILEREEARPTPVDPGLVEQIKGNAYRTRIYPIPAKRDRRVRVEYTTPLMLSAKGEAALSLPMPNAKLKQRDLNIWVFAPDLPAPILSGLGDKRFAVKHMLWAVESHDTNVSSGDNVLVALPDLPEVMVTTENFDGQKYFAVSVKTGETATTVNPDMPDHWRLIWDASGSRAPYDVKQARQLLENLPDTAQYELNVFRDTLDAPVNFNSRAQLLSYIDTIQYDGGTNFRSIQKLANQKFSGPTLFFTDGIDTMNDALPQFGENSVAIMSGETRDVSSMRKICGGRTINLNMINGKDAIHQILVPPIFVTSFKGEGIHDVEGIGRATAGRVTILGRIDSSGDTTGTLQLSNGRTITVNIPAANVVDGKTLATAWAASRIDELSPKAGSNREELLALGRKFSVVSPVSSMIVLETLEQWLRYDIEPPKTLVEMHEKWLHKRKTDSSRENKKVTLTDNWIKGLRNDWLVYTKWYVNPVPPKPKGLGSLNEFDFNEFDFNKMVSAGYAGDAYGMGAAGTGGGGAGFGGFGAGGTSGISYSKHNSPVNNNPSPKDDSDEGGADESFTVMAWDPDMPYLNAIKAAYNTHHTIEALYAEYLKQREKYRNSPSFYFDCANLLFKENQPKLAIRVLSNLAELRIDDVSLLRVYAWRLREAGDYHNAIWILLKVASLRTDEAFSWRDLALTFAMRGKAEKNVSDIEMALELFQKVIGMPWGIEGQRTDTRGLAVIAIEEFNELVAWSKRQKWSKAPQIPEIDPAFRKNLEMDLRILMTWDTDNTDVDMYVIEPNKGVVFANDRRSTTGGFLSRQVSTGYGPEEFLHKKAPKGHYTVQTRYRAPLQKRLIGPATITMTVFRNWGRKNQSSQTMTMRLDKESDRVTVGEFDFK